MKKILVTGAAGTVGYNAIKYLLSEGKYEITILDLKNKKVHGLLKKYKKRVNVIYGDICDRILIEALVKDHDFILHLASILPPLASIKRGITKMIEYDALENIIRSINYYNPNCYLIYASSTTIYGKDDKEFTSKSDTGYEQGEYYSEYKFKAERMIKEKLSKYTIVRVPLVLNSHLKEHAIYSIPKKSMINCITKEDASYAFVKILDNVKTLNKKAINIGGSKDFTMLYSDLLNKTVKSRGINYKLILSDIFLDKNYYSPVCSDIDKYNDILKYQNDTFENYIDRVKYNARKIRVRKLFGKLYLIIRRIK